MTQLPRSARTSSDAPPRTAKDGYWLSFDMHGRIHSCTQALAQVYGCDAAQICDADAAKLLLELPINGNTSRQKVIALMDYVNRSHRLNLTRADGSTVPVDAAITSVLAQTGPLFVVNLQGLELPIAGGRP
jgi:transglutaminase-like putative cysteine protease